MDVLQTKHSPRPDSSPIHMLFLNGLFCSVGTQVEMKISAGGGGALAREVQISELRFKQGDSLGFPFFFWYFSCSCFLPTRDVEFWNCFRHKNNNSAMAMVAAHRS